MKVAIPHWQERVSPVFDSAGNVLLIDIENGRERQREERRLTRTDIMARAGEFLKFGADVSDLRCDFGAARSRLGLLQREGDRVHMRTG